MEFWRRIGAISWPGFMHQEVKGWIVHALGSQGTRFDATLRGAWKWRNDMIIESSSWSIHEACRRIRHDHDEFVNFLDPQGLECGNRATENVWEVAVSRAMKEETSWLRSILLRFWEVRFRLKPWLLGTI